MFATISIEAFKLLSIHQLSSWPKFYNETSVELLSHHNLVLYIMYTSNEQC